MRQHEKHRIKSRSYRSRMEIQDLIEDYELQTKRLERVNDLIKGLCQQVRYADKLLEIKGIGITTVAGFIAEVGDIRALIARKNFRNWQDWNWWQIVPVSTTERQR